MTHFASPGVPLHAPKRCYRCNAEYRPTMTSLQHNAVSSDKPRYAECEQLE